MAHHHYRADKSDATRSASRGLGHYRLNLVSFLLAAGAASLTADCIPGGVEPAACSPFQENITVFEHTWTRTNGPPLREDMAFEVPGDSSIEVGFIIDHDGTSPAKVSVDGTLVAPSSDFNAHPGHLEYQITLSPGAHTLSVDLAGKPGTSLTLTVVAAVAAVGPEIVTPFTVNRGESQLVHLCGGSSTLVFSPDALADGDEVASFLASCRQPCGDSESHLRSNILVFDRVGNPGGYVFADPPTILHPTLGPSVRMLDGEPVEATSVGEVLINGQLKVLKESRVPHFSLQVDVNDDCSEQAQKALPAPCALFPDESDPNDVANRLRCAPETNQIFVGIAVDAGVDKPVTCEFQGNAWLTRAEEAKVVLHAYYGPDIEAVVKNHCEMDWHTKFADYDEWSSTSRHWASDILKFLACEDVLVGRLEGDKRYMRPQSTVQLDEFAKLLVEIAGLGTLTTADNKPVQIRPQAQALHDRFEQLTTQAPNVTYSPCDENAWHNQYLTTLGDRGVLCGEFRPTAHMTRHVTAEWIYRILEEPQDCGNIGVTCNDDLRGWYQAHYVRHGGGRNAVVYEWLVEKIPSNPDKAFWWFCGQAATAAGVNFARGVTSMSEPEKIAELQWFHEQLLVEQGDYSEVDETGLAGPYASRIDALLNILVNNKNPPLGPTSSKLMVEDLTTGNVAAFKERMIAALDHPGTYVVGLNRISDNGAGHFLTVYAIDYQPGQPGEGTVYYGDSYYDGDANIGEVSLSKFLTRMLSQSQLGLYNAFSVREK